MAKATAPHHAKDSNAPHHPPYFQMVCEAIASLKDRTGSSLQAIAKTLEEKYGDHLPPNFRKLLSTQLKNCVKSEKLVKIKNSYKIAASEKAKQGKAASKAEKETLPKARTKTPDLKPNQKAAKKITEKAVKTKRLSRVKILETAAEKRGKAAEGKTKRLSQVKTPEGMKKKRAPTPMKRKDPTPMKRKAPAKAASAPAAKKARK